MKPTLDQILYSMDDTEAAAHLSNFLSRGFKYAVREDANWYFYRALNRVLKRYDWVTLFRIVPFRVPPEVMDGFKL